MYLDPMAGLQPLPKANTHSRLRQGGRPGQLPFSDSPCAVLGSSRLPIGHLTVAEVSAQGLVNLTPFELHRAIEAGHFYAEGYDPAGMPTILPAWQFVPPAPSLIIPIIMALRNEPSGEDPFFWMIAYEELNDLTPAEVLCGRLLCTRGSVSIGQVHHLRRSDAERQATVMAALELLPSRLLRAGP